MQCKWKIKRKICKSYSLEVYLGYMVISLTVVFNEMAKMVSLTAFKTWELELQENFVLDLEEDGRAKKL